MTDRLKEIRERWAKARAAPWRWLQNGDVVSVPEAEHDDDGYRYTNSGVVCREDFADIHRDSMHAIVSAPEDIAWLLARLDTIRDNAIAETINKIEAGEPVSFRGNMVCVHPGCSMTLDLSDVVAVKPKVTLRKGEES
jgi:hypothetical protein